MWDIDQGSFVANAIPGVRNIVFVVLHKASQLRPMTLYSSLRFRKIRQKFCKTRVIKLILSRLGQIITY